MARPTPRKVEKWMNDLEKVAEKLHKIETEIRDCTMNPKGGDMGIYADLRSGAADAGGAVSDLRAAARKMESPLRLLIARKK